MRDGEPRLTFTYSQEMSEELLNAQAVSEGYASEVAKGKQYIADMTAALKSVRIGSFLFIFIYRFEQHMDDCRHELRPSRLDSKLS